MVEKCHVSTKDVLHFQRAFVNLQQHFPALQSADWLVKIRESGIFYSLRSTK